MNKQEALANYLNYEEGFAPEFEEREDNVFIAGDREYLVLTDEESDKYCRDEIRNSLWAFTPRFLAEYMDIKDKDVCSRMITAIQESMYENCNDTLLDLVGDNFNELVEGAIAADGRGHFLSRYDGEEVEEGEYFIYRLN